MSSRGMRRRMLMRKILQWVDRRSDITNDDYKYGEYGFKEECIVCGHLDSHEPDCWVPQLKRIVTLDNPPPIGTPIQAHMIDNPFDIRSLALLPPLEEAVNVKIAKLQDQVNGLDNKFDQLKIYIGKIKDNM